MGVLIRAALVAALLGAGAPAWAEAADEATLRAALVYKLMLFVEWPAGAQDEAGALLVCVVSEDPATARSFSALAGKTVKKRTLQVERRGPLSSLAGCNAAYFDRLDAGLLADKLSGLGARPVLTLASSASADTGTMIRLVRDGERLAFEVRQPSLRAAGLGIDARVLQLAREVYR